VDDELLLYDTSTDKANLLNRTAAAVWESSDGKTNIPTLAQHVSSKLGTRMDESVVWYSLDQLSKKGLLVERATLPPQYRRLSRRDFLKAGLVGSAVLLPVVVSLTVPQVTDAASGNCLADC